MGYRDNSRVFKGYTRFAMTIIMYDLWVSIEIVINTGKYVGNYGHFQTIVSSTKFYLTQITSNGAEKTSNGVIEL